MEYLYKLLAEVQEGITDPIILAGEIKKAEKAIKEVKKFGEEFVMMELEKEKKIQYQNIEISYVAPKKRYSFNHLSEWKDIEKKRKEIESKAKSAAEQMSSGRIILSENTGEVVEPAEIIYSEATYKVSLKDE